MSQKALTSEQLAFCQKITKKITEIPIAAYFIEPVDPKELPDYNTKVRKPMYLAKVQQKLTGGQYASVEKWKEDMNLIWKNATTYHPPGSAFHAIAEELQFIFKKQTEKVPRTEYESWVLEFKKVHQELVSLLEAKPDTRPLKHPRRFSLSV